MPIPHFHYSLPPKGRLPYLFIVYRILIQDRENEQHGEAGLRGNQIAQLLNCLVFQQLSISMGIGVKKGWRNMSFLGMTVPEISGLSQALFRCCLFG